MYQFGFTQKATVSIENKSDIDQNNKVIEIEWRKLKNAFKEIDSLNFVVTYAQSKMQLPYQLEYKGTESIQNLLIQVSCKSKSKVTLQIKNGKKESFLTRTYGRYVPERKDDFAWENDKIAFRTYGKSLENTKENAYGYDVWVKRTSKMIIDERYKNGKYHEDQGNGLDYYHVGLTLGAGNVATYYKDSIIYIGNYQEWQLLDNGPLRTSFKLTYKPWKIGDTEVTLNKMISLDAASQLNKIENNFSFKMDSLSTLVGIVKRDGNDAVLFDKISGIMGYWEPTDPKNGTTGIGVIIPNKTLSLFEDYKQLFSKVILDEQLPFTYYTGACWDKQGDFRTAEEWFEYLYHFKKELDQPLIIDIK